LVFVCVLMQLIIYYCLFISPHNNWFVHVL
jgi:hypothetical protein